MNQPPASGSEHDTDRRSAKIAEERFQLLLEAITDYAIYLLDPNGYVGILARTASRATM